jgi:hypothetical protein
MGARIVTYDKFKADHSTKLKSKITDEDKPADCYRTNAIGIQINGSTVNLGLLNHLDQLVKIPIYRADESNNTPEAREEALENLFEIVADIVRFQKDHVANDRISIDISAAGFAVKNHPKFFRAQNLQTINQEFLYYLDNFPVLSVPGSIENLTVNENKSKFHNFRARLIKAIHCNYVGPHASSNTNSRSLYIPSRSTYTPKRHSVTKAPVDFRIPIDNYPYFINFYYADEAGNSVRTISNANYNVKQSDATFSVHMSVMNDTNTLAFQLGDRLKDGDTVVGVVGGTGFNLGINQGFDNNLGTFKSVSNLECGSTVLNSDTIKPYLSEIDKIYLEKNPSTKPEWFFASGNNDQGLAYIAQSLYEKEKKLKINEYSLLDCVGALQGGLSDGANYPKLTDSNCHSLYLYNINQRSGLPEWLKNIESKDKLTNQFIMDKAEKGDRFALAMVNDFAKRWGGFIASRLQGKNLNLSTTKFAITGSHLQHLLKIPSAKTAFAEALGAPEDNLINIEKGEMDGMQAILKARIAASRAAAV